MNRIARLVGGPKDGEDFAMSQECLSVELQKQELESTVPFKFKVTRGRYLRTEVTLYQWAGWDDEGTDDEQPSDPVGVGPLPVEGD